MGNKTEGLIAVLAAVLLLFSTIVGPVISARLALLLLALYAAYRLYQGRDK